MRKLIFLGLGALSGACASHQPEPATEPSGQAPNAASTVPAERARDFDETSSTAGTPRAPAPQSGTPPRADDSNGPPVETWSTGSDHDSVRNADVGSLTPPAAEPRARSRPDTDDTRADERDRSGVALTPVDQGNGDADIKLTQHIRQSLMADGSLSFTAKNVKIITVNGKVTLRGAVKTAEERESVVSRAGNIAGAGNVNDQLEVNK